MPTIVYVIQRAVTISSQRPSYTITFYRLDVREVTVTKGVMSTTLLTYSLYIK